VERGFSKVNTREGINSVAEINRGNMAGKVAKKMRGNLIRRVSWNSEKRGRGNWITGEKGGKKGKH